MKLAAGFEAVLRVLRGFEARWNRLLGAAVIAATFWSVPSHATVIGIDQFSITRGVSPSFALSPFFTDNFSDGNPPPSAPNFLFNPLITASYGVQGTIPATAESGGVLHLDSANGRPGMNIEDASRLSTIVTLLTSTAGGATQIGVGNPFVESGLFNLVVPSGPFFSGYGIRLTDNAGAGPHQIVYILVEYDAALGRAEVVYNFGNFDAGTVTTLGEVPLAPPVGADQILLQLSRPDRTNDNIFASFSYLSDGTPVGAATNFLTPGLMFQGENFVRAQFIVGQADLPEPGSAWLFIPGVIFLAAGVGMRQIMTKRS